MARSATLCSWRMVKCWMDVCPLSTYGSTSSPGPVGHRRTHCGCSTMVPAVTQPMPCRNSLLLRLLVSSSRTSGRYTAQMQHPWTMLCLAISRACWVVSSTRPRTSSRLLSLTPEPSWTRPSATTVAWSLGPSCRTSLPLTGGWIE